MPKVNKGKCYKARRGSPYIKQPTRHSCGPTALHNLVKWGSNFDLSREPKGLTYRKLHQLCKCKLPFGTHYVDFDRALIEIFKHTNLNLRSFRMYDAVDLKEVTQALQEGCSMLVEFYWKDPNEDEGEHYLMVDRVEGPSYNLKYNIINLDDKAELSDTEKLVSRRAMQSILTPIKYDPPRHPDPWDNIYPKIWIINKTD